MRPLLFGLCALSLAACSRSDNHQLQHDVRSVGADLSADARQVTHDPNIRQVGADLHAAARDADQRLHQTADQARLAADEARERARLAADKAREQAQRARDGD
jgi:hypothetical protein